MEPKLKTNQRLFFKKKCLNNKLGLNCLEKFYKYGFVILKNTPCQKNLFKCCKFNWELDQQTLEDYLMFRSVRKAKDLAYTSQALSAHTDNPYRKPIPGIQLLHCIKNNSEGGHSTLTDGFAVAEYLKKT